MFLDDDIYLEELEDAFEEEQELDFEYRDHRDLEAGYDLYQD